MNIHARMITFINFQLWVDRLDAFTTIFQRLQRNLAISAFENPSSLNSSSSVRHLKSSWKCGRMMLCRWLGATNIRSQSDRALFLLSLDLTTWKQQRVRLSHYQSRWLTLGGCLEKRLVVLRTPQNLHRFFQSSELNSLFLFEVVFLEIGDEFSEYIGRLGLVNTHCDLGNSACA